MAMANRLSASTSAYLRQHANNPVDWYPWGDDAFELARAADKPILLSIGYSACHWCHVMARESFADPGTAEVMNALFVSVKVDREERPDVDALYMEAVQAMTGHGGWPLTVFLTPDGEPFYGGTYFPPTARGGLPGFTDLLQAVASAWSERRERVRRTATDLTAALRQTADQIRTSETEVSGLLDRAVERILARADHRHGGFGGAPKFPQPTILSFLLARGLCTGRADLLAVVRAALDAMAAGGIHDQLAGGFHRYTVDAAWELPHFEKMLYDNAQLLQVYAEAWCVTGEERYRLVAEATADYLLGEMMGGHGAFHAAQDAEAAGLEGSTFVWTAADFESVLDSEMARVARLWYGVGETGPVNGAAVLSAQWSSSAAAEALGMAAETVDAYVARARTELLEARRMRPQPGTDTKVVAAWNGLAVEALARAGLILGREDYVTAALGAGSFLREVMSPGGIALHSWCNGEPGVPAFLEDLAGMANAYLTLYEASFDASWVAAARELVDQIIEDHAADSGGFYRSGSRHEILIARQRDLVDSAAPSGTALALRASARLACFLGESAYAELSGRVLSTLGGLLEAIPEALGASLAVLADTETGWREVVVVGPAEREDTRALLTTVRARYLPATVVASSAGPQDPAGDMLPILAGRGLVDGRATAYVCHQGRCGPPITAPESLAVALAQEVLGAAITELGSAGDSGYP